MIKRWLTELRRRKVLRVAGAYVVAGWGVLQGVEALVPLLGLPDWTVTLVALLLLAGLPVSVATAWVLLAAPKSDPELDAESTAVASRQSRWLDAGLFLAVLLLVGATLWQVSNREAPAAARTDQRAAVAGAPASVAVLPFTSFSDDAQDNYLADGLTEELINGLAQISGLQVPGRTSSFHFKNRNEDLREIGRQLGVAHLLEGSVRRSGERLRVTVQLVSTDDGFHLWSQTYDRSLTDALSIQTDIARHVAESLRATLLADPQGASAVAADADSYPNFLVATGLLSERSPESVTQARALFERILVGDPDNAEALAGYARATILLAGAYLSIDFEPAAALAVEAAERALALAPDNVAANLAAGQVYDVLGQRTDEVRYQVLAERALARAVDLAPDDPEVLRTLGGLMVRQGRWESAVQVTQRAVARDPLDRAARLQLAEAQRGTGRLQDARAELERLLELQPDYVSGHLELGELLMETGAFEAALPHLRLAHESRSMPRATFALANLYLNVGAQGHVLTTLAELDYAPLSLPLAEMIRRYLTGDSGAVLSYARSELVRTGDRIWRPLVVLAALNAGDLALAREQLRLLEPAVLAPEADAARLAPGTVLLAASLLMLEERSEQATQLLESLLAAHQPAPDGFDPVSEKLVRAHAQALLGHVEEVLAELDDARRQGYRTLYDFDNFLRIDRYPAFAALRGDPRFVDLLARIEADNRALAARLGLD
ncbi:MAG: tetratricopeptide repeat protein [Pseudomonadales bacterium]